MLVFLTLPAHASAVDLFTPSSSHLVGDGAIQAESGALGGEGFSGGLIASYTADPALWLSDTGETEPAVAALAPVTFAAGWTLPGVARVSVFLPVYAWVDAPINEFSGGASGDLRVQANVPLWRSRDARVAFALVPRVGLPTGTTDAAIAGGPSAGLVGALSGTGEHLGWAANVDLLGAPNRPLQEPGTGLGSTAGATAAAWWSVAEGLRLGGELDADLGLAGGDLGTNDVVTGQAFVQQVSSSGLGLIAGAGKGLTSGIGSPSYRVFAAVHYTGPDRDHDDDGIADGGDGCPGEREDPDGYMDADGCPDPDDDADGLRDDADLCARAAEDVDGFDDDDGCPDPDDDDDGVADERDACPRMAGLVGAGGCPDDDDDGVADDGDECPTEPGSPAAAGCPGDQDHDGVSDLRDRCPDVAGPQGEDPATADGCPKAVYLGDREIKITERIDFELGSADLTPESMRVLDAVWRLLQQQVAVRKVEVQGHTDNVGDPSANMRLSQSRAQAVVDYLVARGIEQGRLAAKGYGETMPLFSNRTPEGRDQNRRVQLVIVEGAVAGAGAATPVGAPPSGGTGTLEVRLASGTWATVAVDGKRLSRAAPLTGWYLPVGTHQLLVENPRADLSYAVDITVRPGETTTVVVP